MILAGALARRAGVLRREDGPVLVRVVLHLTLPPLIFLILARAELDVALLLVPVAGIATHIVLVLLVTGATRARRVERPRAGALIVATAVGNTGFFGLPLIAASGAGFSQAAAVLYHTLATSPLTWTSTGGPCRPEPIFRLHSSARGSRSDLAPGAAAAHRAARARSVAPATRTAPATPGSPVSRTSASIRPPGQPVTRGRPAAGDAAPPCPLPSRHCR